MSRIKITTTEFRPLGWTWVIDYMSISIESNKYWKTEHGAMNDAKRWIKRLHMEAK